MTARKSDFTLTSLDDLFSTQEQRDDEKLSKIKDITKRIDEKSFIVIANAREVLGKGFKEK